MPHIELGINYLCFNVRVIVSSISMLTSAWKHFENGVRTLSESLTRDTKENSGSEPDE